MTCLRAREFMGDTLGLTLVRALQTSADRHNDASATFAEGFMSEGGKLGRGCRVVWQKVWTHLPPVTSPSSPRCRCGASIRGAKARGNIRSQRGKKTLSTIQSASHMIETVAVDDFSNFYTLTHHYRSPSPTNPVHQHFDRLFVCVRACMWQRVRVNFIT